MDVEAPGANQALTRSEPVKVTAGTLTGVVFRPTLQGAVISKAAAFAVPKDPRKARHLQDIATLLDIAEGRDRLYDNLSKSDLRHLRRLSVLLEEEHDAVNVLSEQSASRVRSFLDVALTPSP